MSILTPSWPVFFRAYAFINLFFRIINLYFTPEIKILLSFPFLFGYTLAIHGGSPLKRPKVIPSQPGSPNIEGALAALDAEGLRDLIRELIPRLDDKTLSRFNNAIIERAARGKTGWQPSGPTDESVAQALAFAKAAKRVGYADPSEIDNYLRQGSNAFLRRNYHAASQIFHALLLPISEGEIDLGQEEMFEEMLGIDASDCAAQYVVAVYMTSSPEQRADAVFRAIEEMINSGNFWEPLREMERVAVEQFPDFDVFLRQWRALVQEACRGENNRQWDADADRWLREAVRRTDGTEGLAGIARSTRRSADLQAWCRALVEAGDWKAALAANEEAAAIVIDKAYSEGDFLDGAALAAQELGRKDLPERLELAWRKAPTILRLRRWLSLSESKGVLKNRAAAAIEACPGKAHRQKAFLHVLLGDFEKAARLLASAPGLGWSDGEHPGHLLFPIFFRLLGGDSGYFEHEGRYPHVDIDELESLTADCDEPCLPNPSVDEIIALAGLGGLRVDRERAGLIKAMRESVRKRIEGLTERKRRSYYDHAALLAAACVAVDGSGTTSEWIAAIRSEYRRFPALQRELDRYLAKVRQKSSSI
jgi:hypothetical protein